MRGAIASKGQKNECKRLVDKSISIPYNAMVMVFLLFWIRVTLKRIVEFVKIYPVITVGGIIIAGAFMYADTNMQLILDFNKFVIICSVLITTSAILSMREYNIIDKTTFYAKGNCSNRLLRYIFFSKKSLLNNLPMMVFLILVFSNRIIIGFSLDRGKIICVFLFSVFLSLAVMVLKNIGWKINRERGRSRDKKRNKTGNRIYINPIIKSTLYDYMDSVLMAVIIIAVSLFGFVNILNGIAEPIFIPLLLFVMLSIGFIGLFDSVTNTNWLFYAVVALDFRYHFKRTIVFILSFYGIVLMQYIFTVMYIDTVLLPIYLFAVISTMFFATGLAYSGGNNLKKNICVCALSLACGTCPICQSVYSAGKYFSSHYRALFRKKRFYGKGGL